jgi:hypothetical protein
VDTLPIDELDSTFRAPSDFILSHHVIGGFEAVQTVAAVSVRATDIQCLV